MTTKRQWILRAILMASLVVAGCVVWGIASIPEIPRDCYGQWVTAELIIRYQQEHGRLAANWQELEPIYGNGRGLHHGGLSFSQVRERIVIEFARLPELQTAAVSKKDVTGVPRIIYPRNGRRAHWAGAEPNQMVYEYFIETCRSRRIAPEPDAKGMESKRSAVSGQESEARNQKSAVSGQNQRNEERMNQCYRDGSEIHIGDSVSFNRQKGKIVLVADRDEYAVGFSDWASTKSQFPSGFMIQFTNGALLFQKSCTDLLEKDKEDGQTPKE